MLADNSFGIIVLLLGTAFLPIVAVTVTAFAKIAVVIFIVRNALGIQQLPPNIILYGLALILSVYVSMPVMNEAYGRMSELGFQFNSIEEWQNAGQIALEPLKEFLQKHTDPKQLAFFSNSTVTIWGDELAKSATEDSMAVLVPSFLLSELTRAFEIGFLLYLPFMAIDIIVTTLLVALGMMMVPPTTISIPFKLMLFVFLDGWTKLVHGLILTYA
ncbi:MAG: type III secretion system export apparatus subunit SctR [Pseudomonadota bacterium]